MSNENQGTINGEWLLTTIKACGENQASAARMIGKRRDFFTDHIKGKTFLNGESLAEFARALPNANMRYVLTGEGSPILTP